MFLQPSRHILMLTGAYIRLKFTTDDIHHIKNDSGFDSNWFLTLHPSHLWTTMGFYKNTALVNNVIIVLSFQDLA